MTNHLAARATSDPKIIVGKPVSRATRVPVQLIFCRLADHSGLNIDDIRAGNSE